MGSETEASSMKLSLFSHRISKSREPQPTDMRSFQLQPVVSIPFHWEESPGKPRVTAAADLPEKSRSLELPPRLLSAENNVKMTTMPSPTTVLDVRRSGFRTLSFSSPLLGSFRSPGPDRKRSSKKVNVEDNESLFEFSASPSSVFGASDHNTSTVRRRKILLTFSSATSNFVQAIVRSITKRFPQRSIRPEE